MAHQLTIFMLLAIATTAYGNSSGAPIQVCDDMTPQHNADPQAEKTFPYTISVNNNEIKAGEKVKITVSGKPFRGFLLQVRDENKSAGSFEIPDDHKYAKTIKCHDNDQSSATHKNSVDKDDITLEWKSPDDKGKTYTVYATVVENGKIYWVRRPTETIKVN